MKFASWFWRWMDNRKKSGSSAIPIDNAAKLLSLRLEDRRVLNVHSVLSGGALAVSMSSAGDVAKLSVVKDGNGNAFLHVVDQLNNDNSYLLSTSTKSTLITSIDIKGSAGDQSVSFQGTNSIDIGTLNIHNSVEYVDVQTAINASLGSVTINASKMVQITDSGSISANDPHSSTDLLNISISSGDKLTAQELFASGSVNLTATNGITVNSLSQTDEIEAGTGITVTVSGNGNGASFLLNSSADLHSDSGGVSILANEMDLQGTINASGQTVSLTPLAPPFNPGSPTPPEKIDIVSNYSQSHPGVLELSASELSNHITAGTLSIGDTNSGNVTVDAPITLTNAMNFDVNTGGQIILMDPVTTANGNQFYSGPVVLGVDTVLATGGGNVEFGSTLNAMTSGVQSLTVNSGTGSTTFDGMVGGLAPLNNLSLTCDSLAFHDKVFGTGTLSLQPSTSSTPVHINDGVSSGLYLSSAEQGYLQSDWKLLVFGNTNDTGGMTVGSSNWASSVTFNSSSYSSITLSGAQTTTGSFTFTGPLTLGNDITLTTTGGDVTIGSTVDGAHSLTVAAATGTVTYNGAVGGNQELTSLSDTGSGTTKLSGNVFTTGTQTYSGAVLLEANERLTSNGDVTFGSRVDSAVEGAYALTVAAGSGTVKYNGAVGGTMALAALNNIGSGVAELHGNVTTIGAQKYLVSVLLGASDRLMTTNSNVTFGSTVDSAVEGAYALTVSAGSATVKYNGAVGGTNALASLNIIGSGTADLNGNVTTIGTQKYLVSVLLGANDTLKTTNSNVTFGSTVDGAYALTVAAGSGTVTYSGAVGSGAGQALTSLSDTGSGLTKLNGNVTTTGTQSYHGAVQLTNNDVLTTTNSDVTFDSTVDGPYALSVAAGSGTVSFMGAVGGTTSLASLTTDAGGSTSLNGNVTAVGQILFNDPVNLTNVRTGLTTNSVTVTSTNAGNVDFEGTVNGADNLVVNTDGVTVFHGVIGGATSLNSLSVSGRSTLDGNVTTTENQHYAGAVTLGNSDSLTTTKNGSVMFDSTVDGTTKCEQSLTVSTGGTGRTTFGGVVGGVIILESLSVSGPSTLYGNVTTCGAQTYSGPVILGASDKLTTTMNGDITFGSTVDGATTGRQSLTVSTGMGSTTFDQAVGGIVGGLTSLGSVSVTSGTIIQVSTMNLVGDLSYTGTTHLYGNVTTTNEQTYSGAVNVSGNIIITSQYGGNIEFYATLDGPGCLTVYTTGLAEFHEAVGKTTPLASFEIPGAGAHAIVFDVTPPVKILHFPEAQVVNDALHDAVSVLTVLINTDREIKVSEDVVTSERLVFFKVTAPDGTFKIFELKELDLDNLLGVIRKNRASDQSALPDGKYEILVLEPGETNQRTVLEFEIVNGSIDDGSESTREQLPSSSDPQQTAPDPENSATTNGAGDGASIDSKFLPAVQTIASVDSSTEIYESPAVRLPIDEIPRFASKSKRIEWNRDKDSNFEHDIGFSTEQEPSVNNSNDLLEDNSVNVGRVATQADGAIIYCSAASLVISGLGALKDKSNAERNRDALPQLGRAARLLRQCVTFRGASL